MDLYMQEPSFLIAPDSFKDCLNAEQVAHYIEKGVKNVFPNAKTTCIPMADGGEGTVHSIVKACKGEILTCEVLDPLGRPTEGFIGLINEGKTAILEMAAASGIEKLSQSERNPWITSTYGTGQLIKFALDKGCDKIVIGIGGSATNDGGMGMAKALGVSFLNYDKQDIGEGGGVLKNLHTIDVSDIDNRLSHIEIIAATDVISPLTGSTGASYVYGPQKGADKQMVKQLDNHLIHFAHKIKEHLNIEVDQLAGGGAAGGLGTGLYAFLGAKLKPGLNTIAELINLEQQIKEHAIIISAEGRVDGQTTAGKTPIGIAHIASKYTKPVFVFGGSVTTNTKELYKNGISAVVPISREPVLLDTALQNAPIWLEKAAEELCLSLKIGMLLQGE